MRDCLLVGIPNRQNCCSQIDEAAVVSGALALATSPFESFNSTRTGLGTSAEGSLTRCRVGRSKRAEGRSCQS